MFVFLANLFTLKMCIENTNTIRTNQFTLILMVIKSFALNIQIQPKYVIAAH